MTFQNEGYTIRLLSISVHLVPVDNGPGTEATDSVLSCKAQVGLVIFPVATDASQRAAWHTENRRCASVHWAWKHAAAAPPGLLLFLGCVLGQAVLREDTKEESESRIP